MSKEQKDDLYWLCENVGEYEAFILSHNLPHNCVVPREDLTEWIKEIYRESF